MSDTHMNAQLIENARADLLDELPEFWAATINSLCNTALERAAPTQDALRNEYQQRALTAEDEAAKLRGQNVAIVAEGKKNLAGLKEAMRQISELAGGIVVIESRAKSAVANAMDAAAKVKS